MMITIKYVDDPFSGTSARGRDYTIYKYKGDDGIAYSSFDESWAGLQPGDVVDAELDSEKEYKGKPQRTMMACRKVGQSTEAPAMQKADAKQNVARAEGYDGQAWGRAWHCASRLVSALIKSGDVHSSRAFGEALETANAIYKSGPGETEEPVGEDNIPF